MSQVSPTPADPILFAPDMEHAEDGEAETATRLDEALGGIRETTFKHAAKALRSVHAKSHGILLGTLTIPQSLPTTLAQGLFARPGRYDVVMRFSTIPGDLLSDDVSTPRGVAMKVIGVEGPRLPGSEADATQDFVMVNGPAFGAPTAQKFLGNLKTLAGTTDRLEGLKKVFSHIARGTEALLEAFGGKSALITTLGGHPTTNILGETFYSQTPFLFGLHYAKFALKPVSPTLTALTGSPVDVHASPDAIRDAVIQYFTANAGEWALQAQLATDRDAMPIEDASVAWPEDRSPYVTVGHVSAPVQDAWSEANRRAVDDGLSFSPWHGLAAHRPLGGVNRARLLTYKNSAAFRGSHNGCLMREPHTQVTAG